VITKNQLNTALGVWKVARNKAILEQTAFAFLTQSHSELIASLREHEHTWSQEEAKFERMSNNHREALQASLRDMEEKCSDYLSLRNKFNAQS
jgi:hypothetical protein